eukprot:403345859
MINKSILLPLIACCILNSLAKKTFKDDAWPKVEISTEFEFLASKMYRFHPVSKQLQLIDGMNLTVRLSGSQNRDIVIVGSLYPLGQTILNYRYNDHKNRFIYERQSNHEVQCDKFPMTYQIDLQSYLQNQIFNETGGFTKYLGEVALPWEAQTASKSINQGRLREDESPSSQNQSDIGNSSNINLETIDNSTTTNETSQNQTVIDNISTESNSTSSTNNQTQNDTKQPENDAPVTTYYAFKFPLSIGNLQTKQTAYFDKTTKKLLWLMDDNNIVGYIPDGLVPKTLTPADFKIKDCWIPGEAGYVEENSHKHKHQKENATNHPKEL